MGRAVVFAMMGMLCSVFSLRVEAQTDVAASVYGAFNSSTSGNDTAQSPSNAAGVLFELRHRWSPLAGLEATYSYNRANQTYTTVSYPPCPVLATCGPNTTTAEIPNNAHEVTGDWFVSLRLGSLRPFALAGGGLVLNLPSSGSATAYRSSCTSTPCPAPTATSISTQTQTKAVFVYGAGVDWTVVPHLGLRFQYRGNVYKAPDVANAFSSTNNFTRNWEPVLGAFFRF